MKTSDFLLYVIGAMGGSVKGRTLLQKTCYFVCVQLGQEDALDFNPHYYGPYSPAIDNTLARMTDLGFIDRHTIGFGASDPSGFEIRRNDYQLTEEGKEMLELLGTQKKSEYTAIQKAVDNISEAGNPGYFELSIAAKAYHIIRARGGVLTKKSIVSEAEQLGWSVQPSSLDRAVRFLEELNLVKTG